MDNDSAVCPVPSDHEAKKIDLLDRQEIVDQIVNLLTLISDRPGSSTFALDGKWGTGKTFVLNMLENALLQQAAGTKFLVFHYNCWKYDYYEEPLVAIVASMLDSVDNENHLLSSEARKNLKETFAFCKPTLLKIASEISKNKLGIDATELLSSMRSSLKENKNSLDEYLDSEKEKNSYDAYYSFNKTLKNTREALNKLTTGRSLVVIVDELDRCQPSYAIKVLERLHHMFSDIKKCSVILAIDKDQLECTIKQVFGDKVSTDAYLKKFIDFELTLDAGTINGNFMAKYHEYFKLFDENAITTNFSFDEFLSALFSDIDIRTQEHLMDRITTIHHLLFPEDKHKDKNKKDYSFMCFELMLLVLTQCYNGYDHAEFEPQNHENQMLNGRVQFNLPEAKSFSTYIRDKWMIPISRTDTYMPMKREFHFSTCVDIPELLIWYQEQMVVSTYKYSFNDFNKRDLIYEQYIEDFKKIRELLKIIK